VTIRDVSDKAGVSPATVSRVFNAPSTVRPLLRERVQAAALVLGYRPNTSARSLRTQRTQAIGVVLPTLLNPVFAECLQGIAQAAAAGGYAIVPITTDYDTTQEARAADLLLARGVDALILCVDDAQRSRVLARLRSAQAPYVLVYNRHARHQGYLQGMQAAALSPQLLEVPFMEGATERIAAHLGALRGTAASPTALVCSNDLLAIRSVRAARQVGLRVPQDLSVIGFDGIALGRDLTPTLATIVQPNARIGQRAVELLVQALATATPLRAADSLTLDLHFQAGESIAAPLAPRKAPARSTPRSTPRRRNP
jgi:DNA-binding LacI/PurR family transcriptional regulator